MGKADEFQDALLVAGSEKQPLIVAYSEFEGHKLLDIRKYYKDKSGELKPTRKGVALNRIQFEAISSVFEEKGDAIETWYQTDISDKTAELVAAEESRYKFDRCEVRVDEWRGLEMFKYEKRGGGSTLVLNRKHKWIKRILDRYKEDDSNFFLAQFAYLLQAFSQALNLIDSRNEYATEVIETIVGNWGIYAQFIPEEELDIA